MEVTYLGHYGDDLTVVNAARVSFAKKSQLVEKFVRRGFLEDDYEMVLADKDVRLIKYLVAHGHVLPFRHPHVSFHFKAPIFVARQLVKHQVGMSWSEISRRYVTGEPEFFWPEKWRAAAPDKKQGSLDEEWEQTQLSVRGDLVPVAVSLTTQAPWEDWAKMTTGNLIELYNNAVENGLAPEQARMILPANLYTEWHWTGSLLAWAHVWKLRVAHDAQKETQDCARQIGPTMEKLFPVSWKALTE